MSATLQHQPVSQFAASEARITSVDLISLALVVSWIREGRVNSWLFANHPMGNPPPPPGYIWSLGLLYLVWALAIVILYFACRWFAELKARRKDPLLRYL
jgi:hypothetical protein